MTRLLGALEREELVRRSPDPDDSRATVVDITSRGTAALASWRAEFRETLAPRFAALTDAEWSALTRAAEILGISIRTLRNKLHEYRAQGMPVPAAHPPLPWPMEA